MRRFTTPARLDMPIGFVMAATTMIIPFDSFTALLKSCISIHMTETQLSTFLFNLF